jgi:uncharacterized protein YndB with AHSA1/START domain
MTQQTATPQATPTEVRTTITVEAPIQRAFEVFTKRIDIWWPREYRLIQGEARDVVIESHAGGRWYERAASGKECDWGKVLLWESPHHLVLTWLIGVGYVAETDPERASRVDVQFAEDSPTRTTVTLVHSQFERHGEGWESLRDGIAEEGGWPGILKTYAKLVVS